jgi:hypothetical protein
VGTHGGQPLQGVKDYLANSPPDGYTTGIVNQSFILTQYTQRTLFSDHLSKS